MRILFLIFSLLLSFALPSNSFAEESAKPLVKIRVLPEKGKIKAGEEIWIGTEQSIAPHWHTYWKNPGDSGAPPTINWVLPDGFEISEIEWPTPHKLPLEPLLNYGYEDKVILLQKLTAAENLPAGPLELTAEIEVLVCKEECIPEYGTYNLTLNGPNAAAENNAPYLNAAKARLPKPTDWNVFFNEDDSDFVLHVSGPADLMSTINLSTTAFFPEEWGLLDNAEKAQSLLRDGVLILKQPRGERAIDAVDAFNGVLAFETMEGEKRSYALTANFKTSTSAGRQTNASNLNILQALIFALLGGLILNLMPCVFPVLSIKALSLVKISEKHPDLARKHGLSYTGGVVLSFVFIAGTLIALQAGGAQIGWGFQLQNPWIVGALGYLFFIIGLNLIGFFNFANPFANAGNKLTQNQGLSGSFFTGVLATLVATPCTAPFMAGAIGFAFVQPPLISLIVFAALGLGLALPYLALSFMPALQKILPKPGPWMGVFKQLLAFPMFLAALWLLWVLAQQTDPMGISMALFGPILIVFGIWLLKHVPSEPFRKGVTQATAIASLIIAFGLLPMSTSSERIAQQHQDYSFGRVFSESALDQALQGDNPVFTEMTAAWCITCKVNHAIAINIESTKALFTQHEVQYLIGDWTNEDPEITKYLQAHGRNGVPLYVYYGPRDSHTGERPEAKILPQILTPAIIEKTITQKP